MTFSNPWFIAALLGVLGLFHLEIIATFLNLAQFRHALPQRLKEIFSAAVAAKGRALRMTAKGRSWRGKRRGKAELMDQVEEGKVPELEPLGKGLFSLT